MSRVLVIFPGALGDLICIAPALWAIRRRYPEAVLELMAREELVRLATGRLGIDRGISIDRREVGALFVAGLAVGANQVFAEYDRIFSFFAADRRVFRQNLIAAARDAEVSFHLFRPAGAEHVAIAALKSIGMAAAPLDYRLRLLDADLATAAARLVGLRAHEFVVIFPGSGSPAKNWPLDSFIALAGRIACKMPAIFILGPAEAGCEGRLGASGFPILSGLELPLVAAIASLSRLFVGNDSGVAHLAASAGAPGIVIFGPSDPARFRPLGKVEVIARRPLEALDVDQVGATVDAKLADRA